MRRSYAGFAPEDPPMAMTTIDLNLKALDALKLKVHESTRADVVRKALALLDVVLDHSDQMTISIGEGDKKVKVFL
jgi:hypothetical protein